MAAALSAPFVSFGQPDSTALRYAATITGAELKQHLEVLASDAYMGRDTGKEGQKMAAAYLRERFASYGIGPLSLTGVEGGYNQSFELVEERNGSIAAYAKDGELRYPDELLYVNESLTGRAEIKSLTVIRREDLGKTSLSTVQARHVLLVHDGGEGLKGLRRTLEATKGASAEVVFVVMSDEEFASLRGFVHSEGSRMRLADETAAPQNGAKRGPQALFVPESQLKRIVGSKKANRVRGLATGAKLKVRLTLEGKPKANRVTSENVLAYIEGSDKKDEVLVITAHYDHIGVENGVVYNGADDDGSGTVALLEIAQAFAMAKAAGHGPRRSLLVMPVSGEEKGLLGSKYYSDHPVFPLESTVANLNIDMIGRTDSAHVGKAPYVYIIGSDRLSSELHAVNEEANRHHAGIELDYTYNAEDDPNRFYYRSDHYNFARKGIPCIFYFSGVHEDYHQPGDDVEKIQFDLLEKRSRLVFHTAWMLANRAERIRVDKPAK